jgi:uncharacterized protein YfaS (alpha-2-macroglobulin family)
MPRPRSTIPTFVLAVTVVAGADAQRASSPGREAAAGMPAPGLSFHLSEGSAESERPALVARPSATPLDAEATRRVVERLPAWAAEAEERPFAFLEGAAPPPRAGRSVQDAFPPSEKPERAEAPAAPLVLVRHAPEGDVPLAPLLSVTFSQPMVAIDTVSTLAREAVPVRLSPEPRGEWRWVGARTLLFQPDERFAMATEYRVEVPAGTRSALGQALAESASWSFSTPAPRLVARHPERGPARRDTLVFAAFDQRIDPAAVLASVHVRAAEADVPVRLATTAEVAADASVSSVAKQAEPGRWLAFRAERPLPPDATITIVVGPGTPSAEGPRRTTAAQGWSFRTYGPFRVRHHACGWRGRECPPGTPFRIELSNPVDAKAFGKTLVHVEPDLPGLKVQAYGDTVMVLGATRGRTTYRVTLSPETRDAFGQLLEPTPPLAFMVGPARPALFAPGGDFVVLDPAGGALFPVYTVNHPALRVEAYAVGPQDWAAWHDYRSATWRKTPTRLPGRRVLDRMLPVAGAPDELVETRIDLSPALVEGLGQLVLVVRPENPAPSPQQPEVVWAWVQVTRLGLDAFVDARALLAWVTSLEDGRPLRDVEVALETGPAAHTDESGLARLVLADTPAALLVARRGRDVAIIPAQTSWWGEGAGWRRRDPRDTLRFCVFDDRRMYRPGEEVHVKGWLRRIGAGPRGDVDALPPDVTAVAWSLHDSRGNEVAKGTAPTAGLGGFDLALRLPPAMNLGTAVVQLEAAGTALAEPEYRHTFEVQEFRRPEFEVKASASEGPYVAGGHATVTVSAAYYAGGALAGAEVSWRVSATTASFRPPNREAFAFGAFVPWWDPAPGGRETERAETFAARTDGSGLHRLRIDFDRGEQPRPRLVRAEATVMDVNRQAWTAAARLLVHPADEYVGLRTERAFVQRGEAIQVEAIVTDLEGRAVPGRRVTLRAERLDWEQADGEWRLVPKDAQEQPMDSAEGPVRARFEGREGGSWRILARVADARGRDNETELRVWVAGGRVPPRRELEEEKVTLVPDRRGYRPGDVAKVLVVAPFAPADALLTLRRAGLLREQRFTIPEGSYTLEIPIEEAWTPNVHVQVDLVGSTPGTGGDGVRAARGRPAFATGILDLPVPPMERALELDVAPRERAVSPRGATVLDVALRDPAGRPVPGGEVAIVVVDEAVLALTGYRLPDPLDVFYARRDTGVQDHRLRTHVLLAQPEETAALAQGIGAVGGAMAETAQVAAPAARTMALQAAGERPPEPIRIRTDFSPLALFAARFPTDSEGRAHVPVKLPDSLTRYRVMAVGAEGARRFGSGESTLVVRLPLMVRPSPPRFLNFGDRIELPLVVQNQTDGEMTVEVVVRAANATLLEGGGRRIVVAANDRAEVRFPVATARAGTARFQVGAVSGRASDAAEFQLPVRTPATTEDFATYGQIDRGAIAQPIASPEGVVPEFGGLEVTTSSTALQALTDAVLYLVAYPFECAEQLSSRVLAVAALKDVLAAFDAEGLPKPAETVAAVKRDVERLRGMQNEDGGFAFWRRGDRSWPYVSIHVAHALARAREKGFAVPDDMLDRARDYLRGIGRRIPDDYPADVRRTIEAYALAVRARMGDADAARARSLVREAGVGALSFEALGWVLPVLSKDLSSQAEAEAIRRRLANGVDETAAAAHFVVSYGDGAHLLLHSDRRADAIVLEALIDAEAQPSSPASRSSLSDLVPKLVEGLLAYRTAGRWMNTQENVFVLLALDRYFQALEKTRSDFVARAWLGERFAGEHAFRGRTTERYHLAVPMPYLREAKGTADLVLAKDGPGRLYYRIGLRYAPASLRLAPLDRGFTVERAYEAVDDPGDVRRDAEGTWHVRPGARVRVRLTMVAPGRRSHVALVDPLPAGLEPLNPSLATTGAVPEAGGSETTTLSAPGLGDTGRPGHWWWWSRPWFEHQNLRDDRAEAFASLVWEGVYTYRYVARATTPGAFVVPPPKAEEMYSPETFGRGASDRMVVE